MLRYTFPCLFVLVVLLRCDVFVSTVSLNSIFSKYFGKKEVFLPLMGQFIGEGNNIFLSCYINVRHLRCPEIDFMGIRFFFKGNLVFPIFTLTISKCFVFIQGYFWKLKKLLKEIYHFFQMFHGTITEELISHEEWSHYNQNIIEDQKDFVFVKFNGLHLKSMENLQSCISLRVCIFSNNFITDISALQSCIKLIKLDLHGNQVSNSHFKYFHIN